MKTSFWQFVVQDVIARFKQGHSNLEDLPTKAVFQMNDTHPTIAVAELMRILIDQEGLDWDKAWSITVKVQFSAFSVFYSFWAPSYQSFLLNYTPVGTGYSSGGCLSSDKWKMFQALRSVASSNDIVICDIQPQACHRPLFGDVGSSLKQVKKRLLALHIALDEYSKVACASPLHK